MCKKQLERFNNIDTDIMEKANAVHIESIRKFEENVKEFETNLSKDFRRWR